MTIAIGGSARPKLEVGRLSRNVAEVVIACHSAERPLGRAVASVLEGNGDLATVTVVAHNISASVLRDSLAPRHAMQVRWLELADGTRSPANPYNFGTSKATAEWVSLLGSDDFLQPGAVAAWLTQSARADAVITRLLYDRGGVVRTPPVRPFTRSRRDAVRDRLYYRSAPLGLMRRGYLEARDFAWDPDLKAGGDLRLSTLLWSEGRVAVQTAGPGYVIGADASDRVTMRLAPLSDELSHVERAWGPTGWARSLTGAQQRALAIKYLRIHFFGAAYYRAINERWGAGDRETMAAAIELVLRRAPSAPRPLSVADRRLLAALRDLTVPDTEVNRLAKARRSFLRPSALVPKDLAFLVDREAPLRFMASSALVR